MSNRAVQEPEAWFSFKGGLAYIEMAGVNGQGFAFKFRLNVGSSGNLLYSNGGDYISVSEGIVDNSQLGIVTCGNGDFGQDFYVTLNEWHGIIFRPLEKIIIIDSNQYTYNGTASKGVRYLCYNLNNVEVSDMEINYNDAVGHFIPNQNPLGWLNEISSEFYELQGDGTVYYMTPDTPEPPTETGWITVNPTAGTGTTVVTLTAGNYTGTTERQTSFRIEGAHGTIVYLTAIQNYEQLTNNVLLYKTNDNRLTVTPNPDADWPEILSNTFQDGWGRIVFAETLTKIPDYAFDDAFEHYAYTMKEVVMPDTVTYIGTSAFEHTDLSAVTLSNNLETIGNSAFAKQHLTGHLILPDSVKTIGINAFYGFSGGGITITNQITGLTLGPNILSIGSAATSASQNVFSNALKYIYIKATTPPAISKYTFYDAQLNGRLMYDGENTDYSSWLSDDMYYLGYYNWNGSEYFDQILYLEFEDTKDYHSYTFNTSIMVNPEFSYDGINWGRPSTFNNCKSKTIYFRCDRIENGEHETLISTNGDFSLHGDISQLFRSTEDKVEVYDWLFSGNTHLISVNELRLSENGSYYCMFQGCSNLTDYPYNIDKIVPKGKGYGAIFAGCNLPILPNISDEPIPEPERVDNQGGRYYFYGMYAGMCAGNTGATNIPLLPATVLTKQCYDNMFSNCTSLVTSPALPATTVPYAAYRYMFGGCTGLTTAPALPATIANGAAYKGMFKDCTSLVTAPAISASTIVNNCCCYMFSGCTSLVNAPSLSSITAYTYDAESFADETPLEGEIYVLGPFAGMFEGCTSLVTAPDIPDFFGTIDIVGTIGNVYDLRLGQDYDRMFKNCTSLVNAPEIPGNDLDKLHLEETFYGCSSLTYVKLNITGGTNYDALENMLSRVASTGTLVIPSSSTCDDDMIRVKTGMPSGWTIVRQ